MNPEVKQNSSENPQSVIMMQGDNQSTPSSTHNKSKLWLNVVAISMVCLLIGGGVYFYLKTKNLETSPVVVDNALGVTPQSFVSEPDATSTLDNILVYKAIKSEDVKLCNDIQDKWKQTACLQKFEGFKFREERFDLAGKIFQRDGKTEDTTIFASPNNEKKGSWFASLVESGFGLAEIKITAELNNAQKGEALLTTYLDNKVLGSLDGRVQMNPEKMEAEFYVPPYKSDNALKILGFRLDSFGTGEVKATIKDVTFKYYTNSPFHMDSFSYRSLPPSEEYIPEKVGYSKYTGDSDMFSFLYPSTWRIFKTKSRSMFSYSGVNVVQPNSLESNASSTSHGINNFDFAVSMPAFELVTNDPLISISGIMTEDAIPDAWHFDFTRHFLYSYMDGKFQTYKDAGLIEILSRKNLVFGNAEALLIEYKINPDKRRGVYVLRAIDSGVSKGDFVVPAFFAIQYIADEDKYSEETADVLIRSFKENLFAAYSSEFK